MKILEDLRFLIISVSIILIGAVLYFVLVPNPEATLKKDIQRNPEKYQKIVQAVISNKNKLPLGKLVANQNIPASLKEEIDKVGVNLNLNYLTIDNASDCDKLNITLIYSGNYEIEYNPCPNMEQRHQNEYYKKGFIEIWKVNQNWSIMRDSDFM